MTTQSPTRTARIERTTKETAVLVELDLDGTGTADIETGVPFFDHMLDQLGRHGRIDLHVRTTGDLEVDAHHTVEDTGIAIGQALAEAWGDKAGIERFGDALVPIDEALARVAVDLSGRPYLVYDADTPVELVGTYETSLTKHFFEALVANSRISLHVSCLAGDNSHHIQECVFKGVAVALRRAVAVTGQGVPSTKGVLQ
ncbi:imidazoleglycerol-phosphate dehydratase HisB [Euzebya tangerina]|uniref:imidazoleglycerol-phosphate dehydratase HisB n=1 Tax=Euzebya tangerina TaxID=591198 RepID=UPI000E316CC0|nr:imidazoleglycerol-phosphate dehydratase HisB [Euzebya tangerina]